MHPYNVKQIAEREKRKRQLQAMRKRMSVKEIAAKLNITHQAVYKAMRP